VSDEDQRETAPIIPLFTQGQIGQHVQTILDITKLDAFRDDSGEQAQAFLRVQAMWPQLSQIHQEQIRMRVCEALGMSEGRFRYLVAMKDFPELQLALRYQRLPFERTKEERAYPDREDGWLGSYLRYAEVGEAHVGWHFWSALVALGAMARRNFYLLGGHKRLYPNLYVMLEGPSGSGKNTAIERALDLLKMTNKLLDTRGPGIRGYIPSVTMLPSKMTPPILSSGLIEGRKQMVEAPLRGAQVENDYEHIGCCVAPEAATLLSQDQFGVDQLIVLLTQCYDGWMEDATNARGTIKLNNVVLSLLLGSTMSWLRKNITATMFEGGFMGARCLVIPKGLTGRSYYREPLIDPVQRTALAEQLTWYAEHAPTEMHLSTAADNLYRQWYEHRETVSEDDRIASYYGRKRVYLLKLSMLFALSRYNIPTIELRDMESAIALLRMEETTMLPCFREVLSPEIASQGDWIMRMIGLAGGKMPRRDIMRRSRGRLSANYADEILASLQEEDRLRSVQIKNKRGPDTILYYQPELWDEKGNRVGATLYVAPPPAATEEEKE